jgi:hypothetical protein
VLACIGAYVIHGAGGLAGAAEIASAVALVLLATAVAFRVPGLVPWAVAAAAAGYIATRTGHRVVDGWAAVVGAGLLLAAELAFWAAGEDVRIHTERAVVLRRAATLAALVAAGLVTGFLLLAAAAVSSASGVAVAAVGVAAAIGAVGLALRLLRAA